MRAYVFTDTSLARHAGRFVWLGIDEEVARNAPFRKRFDKSVPGLPTFLVIDPASEVVRMAWVGGFTVPQLHTLLDDAATGGGLPKALLTQLTLADSLYGAAAYAASATAYEAVRAAAPRDAHGRTRVVEAELFARSQAGDDAGVMALAREELPGLGATISALNAASSGLSAALDLPDTVVSRRAAIAEFEAATRRLVADPACVTTPDDRSGAYMTLLEARKDARDSTGARATAVEWSAYLDARAAEAKTPDQRAALDAHRMSAYIELGTPERAVPMLRQSELERPDDYNPHARLAITFNALKRYDEALAESDQAMKLADGPRRLTYYLTRADIHVGRGDLAAARRTIEDGLAFFATLPPDQQTPGRRRMLERKRDSLPKP